MASAQLSARDITALQAQAKAEKWTFSVGETTATKRPSSELCGFRVPPNWQATARFVKPKPKLGQPPSWDWRALGGCTAIKDQASCGSCWAFGTVGPLECNILIKDGIEVDLSECNQIDWGCGGGFWAHDYHLAPGAPGVQTDLCGDSGAVFESDFPYQALDLPCDCPYPHAYSLTSWAYIGSGGDPTVDDIKQAIMDYGPVSVALHAGYSAFLAYTGGVFNACENGSVDHAVVLVGWDDSLGASGAWILRNSWGAGWGEAGYMYIEYGCSYVGYAACFVDYPVADDLAVTPSSSMASAGSVGGPFDPASRTYTLTNNGATSLDWQAAKSQSWVDMSSPTSGTLAPAASADVTVSINSAAHGLAAGTYTDTVTFTNVTSGHVQSRQVNLHISPPAFYSEPLDADPGWTTQGEWAFGVPQGLCGDPVSGYTGANVYGYNLAGCYPDSMTESFLTTSAMDCSGHTGVLLRFWRRLGVESSLFDHARVQVSNDGANWTDVWTHGGDTLQDPAWVSCEYDISAVADMQPTVYIRWGMGPSDYSVTYAGWNIDDIQLLGNYIDDLSVLPASAMAFSGYESGPFTPDSGTYTLRDVGGASLTWSVTEGIGWLDVSANSGMLAPDESIAWQASLNASVNSLTPGTYPGTLTFTNLTSSVVQTRSVSLAVLPNPGEIDVTDSVLPADDLAVPFGTVLIGQVRTEQITVSNVLSTYGLIVTEISLGGASTAHSEDFNDGLAQGWEPANPAYWAVVTGEYRAQAGGLYTNMTSTYTHGNWNDLAAQVSMRRTGSEYAVAAVFARTSPDFQWDTSVGSGYGVGISTYGLFWVAKWVNGTFTFLQSWSPSPYLT